MLDRFTNQTIRLLLRTVACALLLASGTLLWQSFGETPPLSASSGEQAKLPQSSETARASVTRPLAEFELVWQRKLGDPLYPMTKVAETPTKKRTTSKRTRKKAPPGLRLIGTVLESGRSLAMLADASGDIHVRGVGEKLDLTAGEAQIDRIELQQVELSIGGRPMTLKMKK